MVRPCVARGFRRSGGFAVLHQCIRPLIGARCGSGPSWISARVRSHYRTGLERAIWVTSVRTRREDRSSISSHPLAGNRCWGYVIDSSSSRAVPLFVIAPTRRRGAMDETLTYGLSRLSRGKRKRPGHEGPAAALVQSHVPLIAIRGQLGQHRRPSGPRWKPRGHARPLAIGWHRPAGPRHHPGPHPSATLMTALSALPTGTGAIVAPAAAARPKASATPKKPVLITAFMHVSPWVQANPNGPHYGVRDSHRDIIGVAKDQRHSGIPDPLSYVGNAQTRFAAVVLFAVGTSACRRVDRMIEVVCCGA